MADRRPRKPTIHLRRRYDTWTQSLTLTFTMLVAFPAGGVVFGLIERIGSSPATDVLAVGTATVSSCERGLLTEAYSCAASVVWHETASFGEPPATVRVRSTRALAGEVEVEERSCGSRYTRAHKCPVYAADYPTRHTLLFIPPFATMLGVMFAGWLVARRIATRITGYPPARPAGKKA